MNIQLILLAVLLIIGVYELYTLSFNSSSEKELPLFWKKTIKYSKLFDKGIR
jgi:hypothetical protein